MYNNLKREIEKEFDKQQNYENILSKVERVSVMKKLKYVLTPVFVLVTAFVVITGVNGQKKEKTMNMADSNGSNIEVVLNINKLGNMGAAKLDVDVKIIETKNLPEKYEFINNILIPEELKLTHSYNRYTRKDIKVDNYDILYDYVFLYETKESNKHIILAFSELGEPLRDYFINHDQSKKSKIGDTEVTIWQYKDLYMATFTYNNINFDIETTKLSEEELVKLLISIIK